MAVCAITIRESGRGCLGIALLILNMSIAMISLIMMILATVLAVLFHQQKDMLKDFNYKALTHFVIFSAIALILFHLVTAKISFDCGSYKTRGRFQNFLMPIVGLLFVSLGLLITLSIKTSAAISELTTGFEKGFLELMDSYDADKNKKLEIDIMQVRNKCCGSKGYKDWEETPWHADEYIRPNQKVRGVPFTCCDPEYPGPCLHDSAGSAKPGYKADKGKSFFPSGCAEVVTLNLRWMLNKLSLWLILPIWMELIILVLVRYLQTSINNAIEQGDDEGPGYGYLCEKCPCSCFEFLETDIRAISKKKKAAQ